MAKRSRHSAAKVKLGFLDSLVHYSLALYLGTPVVVIAIYFALGRVGVFRIERAFDIAIIAVPGLILVPFSLIAYWIQKEKLEFEFIPVSVDMENFRKLIQEISSEHRWAIHSCHGNSVTMKTDPGFVNQSWGQHITFRLVEDGILVNSIFDPNKGSWLVTFGSNARNVKAIKQLIYGKVAEARNEDPAIHRS